MNRHILGFGALLALSISTIAPTAFASEIHYGHIKDSKSDTLLLEYKSPGGAQYFTCDVDDGDCDSHGDSAPTLYEPITGIGNYPRNTQGTYGIRQFIVGGYAYYMLYDLRKDTPKKLGQLPIIQPVDNIKFSPNGNSILFFKGKTVQRYDIREQHLAKTITLSQSSLPFTSVSPKGTYLSAYNYGEQGHKIWNTNTGDVYTVESTAPSYVEYSQDETSIAFADRFNDFKTLFFADISKLPTFTKTRLMSGATVEDYVFVNDTLYFMANIGQPLIWNIYEYNHVNNTLDTIDTNVSYGDFMQAVDDKLAYLKVDGKNANVHLYNPKNNKELAIKPIKDSPAATDIKRKAVNIRDRSGALLSPKKENSDPGLFIWLHGGPQRQTSVGYHSYLSYAVYDELLEKLVSAGNYVLKLDYTGSTGYGDTFRKALHKQIGVVDVKDVRRVTRELQRDLEVDTVYLIGNSYGGYLSLKTLAEDTKLFDGAISINGVTDWYSLISRIPSSPFNKLFEGEPSAANLDAYLSASAYTGLVNNIDDEKILVVYGDNDSSVPTWQSKNYVEFAEANDKNVKLLKLEGEDHVLKKRSSLTALCTTIESFFKLPGISCKNK